MNVRLLSLSLLTATGLAACGSSQPPEPPAAPPTGVAAVKTPRPQYPMELACTGVGGTSTFKVTIPTDRKPSEVLLVTGAGNPQPAHLPKTPVPGSQFKPATRNRPALPATIHHPVCLTPPPPPPPQRFALHDRMLRPR